MSWWDENGIHAEPDLGPGQSNALGQQITDPPPMAAGDPASPDDFAKQVTGWYQQYLGRTPSPQEIESHRGNPGGLQAVQKVIQDAAGKNGEANPGATPSGGPPTLNPNDPASVSAYISYYASQPGANPSLKNDPNYWAQKISSGELGSDPNYIVSKFMTPEGATYGPSTGAAPANFGAAPPAYTAPVYTPPPAYVPPTWQGGAPPTAPTLTHYTPPTQAELEASPGYQARLAAGQRALDMSAAAHGTVLNGGTQKATARYGQDYASNEYGTLVAQGQATTQINNAATQTGFGDAFSNYQARYGQFTDAAAMGKNAYDTNYGIGKNAFDTNAGNGFQAFQTNVSNKRNADTDYWTRLNDLYSTGANLAAGSYRPPQ